MAGAAPPPYAATPSVPIYLQREWAQGEHESVSFPPRTLIAYGKVGHPDFMFKYVGADGTLLISKPTFGGDPVPNVFKAGYFVPGCFTVNIQQPLASEGQTLNYAPGTVIAYGSPSAPGDPFSRFSFRTMPASGQLRIANDTFGDPTPGIVKQAYLATWTSVVQELDLAAAAGRLTIVGREHEPIVGAPHGGLVGYGQVGHDSWSFRHFGITCTHLDNQTFGDPAPGTAKIGIHLPGRLAVKEDVELGQEGHALSLPPGTIVAYGRAGTGRFGFRVVPRSGQLVLDNKHFGDPVPGVAKAGYLATYIPF